MGMGWLGGVEFWCFMWFFKLSFFETYDPTLTIGQELHAGCWRCI